jgi:hypothetical protein
MACGGKTTVMLNCLVAVWAGLALSVTCTVKVKVPAVVGVPEMTPDELSNRLEARLPEKA